MPSAASVPATWPRLGRMQCRAKSCWPAGASISSAGTNTNGICRRKAISPAEPPVEMSLTPQTEELFQDGWSVTWNASAGAAASCDTFLITDEGPRLVTPTEYWPLMGIRIQGDKFLRPDVLQR